MTVQPPGDRPAPGYYPDPSIPGFVRYWDGDGWTPGSARPAPPDGVPLPPPPRIGSRGPLRVAPPPPPRAEETGPVFLDETGAAALTVPAVEEYRVGAGAGAGAEVGAAATVWNASPEAQRGLLEPEVPRWVSWGMPEEAPASADAAPEEGQGQAPAAPPAPPAPTGGGYARISAALEGDADRNGGDAGRARGVLGADDDAAADDDADDELASALRLALSQTRRAHLPPVSYYEAEAWAGPLEGHAGPVEPSAPSAAAPLPVAPLPATPLPPAQQSGWEGTGHPSFDKLLLPPEPTAPPAAMPPAARATPPAARATPPVPGVVEPETGVTDDQALHVGSLPVAQRGSAVKPGLAAPAAPASSTTPTVPQVPRTAPRAAPTRVAAPAPTAASAPTAAPAPPRVAQRPSAGAPSKRVRAAQAKARPALLGPRLGARLLDTAVSYALVGVLGVVLVQRVMLHLQAKIDAAQVSGTPQTVWLLDGTVLANAGILLAALLAVGVVYEAVPTAAWGRTLGKAVFGLRVLDARTRQRPGLGRCLLRTAVTQTLVFVLLGVLELVPCATDRKLRQSWHDKLARTFVAKR